MLFGFWESTVIEIFTTELSHFLGTKKMKLSSNSLLLGERRGQKTLPKIGYFFYIITYRKLPLPRRASFQYQLGRQSGFWLRGEATGKFSLLSGFCIGGCTDLYGIPMDRSVQRTIGWGKKMLNKNNCTPFYNNYVFNNQKWNQIFWIQKKKKLSAGGIRTPVRVFERTNWLSLGGGSFLYGINLKK